MSRKLIRVRDRTEQFRVWENKSHDQRNKELLDVDVENLNWIEDGLEEW